jgi:hypothetical protein
MLLAWLESGEDGPDVAAILRGISNAASPEVLRANFETAMQMLPEQYHDAISKAKNVRYRELVPKTAAAPKPGATQEAA